MGDQKKTNESFEGGTSESLPDLASRFPQESKDPSKDLASEVHTETINEQSGVESDDTYQKILSNVKVKSKTPANVGISNDASLLDQQMDRESQISVLIDLAVTTSIEHAVAVARHAEDYYVLDQLHDRLLADDLHDALLQKGMIDEI